MDLAKDVSPTWLALIDTSVKKFPLILLKGAGRFLVTHNTMAIQSLIPWRREPRELARSNGMSHNAKKSISVSRRYQLAISAHAQRRQNLHTVGLLRGSFNQRTTRWLKLLPQTQKALTRPGDLIHADCHGAIVIPVEVADKLPAAAELLARREEVILTIARSKDFSIEKLKAAMAKSAEVH